MMANFCLYARSRVLDGSKLDGQEVLDDEDIPLKRDMSEIDCKLRWSDCKNR